MHAIGITEAGSRRRKNNNIYMPLSLSFSPFFCPWYQLLPYRASAHGPCSGHGQAGVSICIYLQPEEEGREKDAFFGGSMERGRESRRFYLFSPPWEEKNAGAYR